MKPNKQIIVNDILLEMEVGISYSECLELNKANWGLAPTTFDRYWKEAQNRFKALLVERDKLANERALKFEQEAIDRKILTKLERQELLSKMATGEILAWREVVTEEGVQRLYYYSAAEAKQNIAELNKMDGDYAPIKKDITSGGERITKIDFTD